MGANDCYANILVRGRKEAVEEFDKILNATYNYEKMEFSHIPHLNRISEIESEYYQKYGLLAMREYIVDCAWSASSCLLNTPGSYYYDRIEHEKRTGAINHSTNIVDISKEYGLDIEIWSQEDIEHFEEHILVQNGEVKINETYDFYEFFIDDYNTYEEFIKDINEWYNEEVTARISKEQFDEAKSRNELTIRIEDDSAYNFSIDRFEIKDKKVMCEIINND